jgi:hypothetical protein
MTSFWPPTFNVVFVPGTVDPLFDFARSLAEHSPYRFRLVSNACTPAEEALLADRCSTLENLECASLENTSVLPHGEALQRLFAREHADYFAFIDSDVLARGPFLSAARSLLDRHAALFSALPSWLGPHEHVLPTHFVSMGGRFSQTDDGRCLGVSYCAVYRRTALETVMNRTGVTFHARQWWELPADQRALLATTKLAKRKYDTLKLVNIMLGQSGFSLVMCPEPNLMHLGGLSNVVMRPSNLAGRVVARLSEIIQWNRPGPVPRRRAVERRATLDVFKRRRLVEDYFQHLLAGGPVDGGPARLFPASGRQQLVEIGREIAILRRRYRDGASLPGGT